MVKQLASVEWNFAEMNVKFKREKREITLQAGPLEAQQLEAGSQSQVSKT